MVFDMADKKTDDPEVSDEKHPKGEVDEATEKINLSESVRNLSSKSLKQLSKWNNESFLYAFDRQLISFGIRLLLFLPGFAILAYFGSWAYANSSPDWWIDFIEPTIGQSFSTILVALVFVILLAVSYTHLTLPTKRIV